jgi:hypothetical protein
LLRNGLTVFRKLFNIELQQTWKRLLRWWRAAHSLYYVLFRKVCAKNILKRFWRISRNPHK